MDNGLEFFQRRHPNSQQVCENVLTNHKENINQNHNEISPQICYNDHYQKDKRKMLARMW